MSQKENMIPLWIGILLVVIIICMAGFYYYSQYQLSTQLQKPLQQQLQSQLEPHPSVKDAKSDEEALSFLVGNGKPKVILLHAQWCGHCRNMMKSFTDAAASSSVFSEWYRIDAGVSPSVVRRDDVKGFPTIFGVMPSGQLKQHTGGRDLNSLQAFVRSLSLPSSNSQLPLPPSLPVEESTTQTQTTTTLEDASSTPTAVVSEEIKSSKTEEEEKTNDE